MIDCIDLIAKAGRRYRTAYELPTDLRTEAHGWPRDDWPWLARILCHHGHVGVHGGERLYAFTDHPRIGAQLRALPFIERAQGDAEVRVVFHVDHQVAVLKVLKPYRRRQGLSDAQRAALAAGRRPFERRASVENRGQTAPESTQDAQDGESDIPA